jgi:hypothetical protein
VWAKVFGPSATEYHGIIALSQDLEVSAEVLLAALRNAGRKRQTENRRIPVKAQ